MANRDLSNFRTVLDVVVDKPDQTLAATAAIGEQILRQGQEARITENISKAQLELNQLETQYKIDFEGDPLKGMDKYKQDRQGVLDKYGKDISPLYNRQWRDQTKNIVTRNDASQQAWALKQTRTNSINSINKSIKNNLMQASTDGQNFGNSDSSEVDAFINFGTSSESLIEFGGKNLGTETTAALMEDYGQDYMKSFLSGVSEVNPEKALRLMEQDTVRESFGDPQQFLKMKDSLEIRAKRFRKSRQSAARANSLAAENAMRSNIGSMGYAAQQTYFEENDVSPVVREFYQEVSGYANRRKAVKGNEKVDLKRKFQLLLSDTLRKEDVSDGDLRMLQDAVYGGMKKGVLSESEGFGYVDQLMSPIIEKKKQQISQFETGEFNPFQKNLGLDTLEDEILEVSGLKGMPERNVGADDRLSYKKTANQMYDLYYDGLAQQAEARGVTVGQLSDLPFAEEEKVYNAALKNAKDGVLRSLYPSLRNVEEMPAKIITKSGDQINTGLGKGKPSGKVDSPKTELSFSSVEDMESAGLEDGTIVYVNGVKGVYRK